MTMKYLLVGLSGVFCFAGALYASTDFYTNSQHECYVDTPGNDWYWFCGNQSKSCGGNAACCNNQINWLYHGEYFEWTKHGGEGKYWCCNGTGEHSGQFVHGSSWITKTETVTETLPEGKCTWIRKTNICGQIDNPNDKCTEATGQCSQGFVSHNGKCVKSCEEGQAFESATSNSCVSCEPSPTQGVKQGICIKCAANQFYNINQQKCVDRSTMVQVSNGAHDDCWMCSTPGALYNCMKTVSNGGSLSQNAKLQAACSVNAKEADATAFKLPQTSSVSLKSAKLDLTLGVKKLKKAASMVLQANK